MTIIIPASSNTPVLFEESSAVIWKQAKATEIIKPEHIDIWRIYIPSYTDWLPQLYQILRPDELKKSASFLKESDSIRYIISRAMLRILLGRYLNKDPRVLNFTPGLNKKPTLQTQGRPILDFNTCHSGDYILIAVGLNPLGIDIERIENFSEIQETMQLIFNTDEISFIQEQASPLLAFYKLWTRKEALLKAASTGIINQLKDIPCLNGKHLIDYNLLNNSYAWQVRTFNADEKYAASIAYTGKILQLLFKEFNVCEELTGNINTNSLQRC